MYGLNPQHTGASAVTGPQSGALAWYSLASWDHTVVVGTDGLYTSTAAINFDGSLRWSYPLGVTNVSPALTDDGTIYTGSESGLLYAFSPNLLGAYVDENHALVGGVKWALQIGKSQTSPVIGPDGTVFVSALDSYLYAVNPNGTLKWRFQAGQGMESSPALSADGSVVYVGSDDNSLYAINTNNGTQRWKYKASDDVNASPAVGPDGTIYFTTSNWLAWAIGADGRKKWSASIAPRNTSLWADGGCAVDPATGTVYAGGSDGLYAFSYGGTLKWKAAAGAPVWSHPAVGADGVVYFHARDGILRAVRPNGSALWSASVGSGYAEPVLGSDGTLYIAGQQIGLSAFRGGGVGRPTISWLYDSPDPVAAGGTLTLAAVDTVDGGGTWQRVDFYRDADGNGQLDAGVDMLLGSRVPSQGYPMLSVPVALPAGTYTYFAVATDDQGHQSNVVSTTNTVAAPLRAEGGPADKPATAVTAAQLSPLVQEATRRWQAAGLAAAQTAALRGLTIQLADLGGTTLGLASGHTIWLDDNAAGWGWFVDKTPRDDREFTAPGEQGRMDLLTVLMHEMGHLLGLDHDAEGVMQETLPAGTRRLPTPGDWHPVPTPAPAPPPAAGGRLSSGPAMSASASTDRDHYFAALVDWDWDVSAIAVSLALEARRKG
jgi:outer membrane protein assembly factor BamB